MTTHFITSKLFLFLNNCCGTFNYYINKYSACCNVSKDTRYDKEFCLATLFYTPSQHRVRCCHSCIFLWIYSYSMPTFCSRVSEQRLRRAKEKVARDAGSQSTAAS